ncbi:MAG: HDOD domain-containing protein [Fibrobacterota bacterium]
MESIADERLDTYYRLLEEGGRNPLPLPTAAGLSESLRRGRFSLERIARQAESDPVFAFRLLALANSRVHGRPREGASIREAVLMLPAKVLRNELLEEGPQPLPELPDAWLNEFYRHAISVSRIAFAVAARSEALQARAAEVRAAALLHDFGLYVMAVLEPVRFTEALRTASAPGSISRENERERFGLTHADLGGVLSDLYQLPLCIEEAMLYHATPEVAYDRTLVEAVAVADQAAHALETQTLQGEFALPLDPERIKRLGLTPEGFKAILEHSGK